MVTPQKFKFNKKTRNFEVQYLPHITVDLSNKDPFRLQQNIGQLQSTLYDLMLHNHEILKNAQPYIPHMVQLQSYTFYITDGLKTITPTKNWEFSNKNTNYRGRKYKLKLYLSGTQLKYTETDDIIYGVYCDQAKYKYVCYLDINTNQAKIREYVYCDYTLKYPTLLENKELSISIKNLKFIKLGIKTNNIPWIIDPKTKEITAHTTHKILYYDTDFKNQTETQYILCNDGKAIAYEPTPIKN